MTLPPDIIAGSLSDAQQDALRAFCSRANSPWGYYAADLGASGAACAALARKRLLTGGLFAGDRTRSYRWTELGQEVFALLAQAGRHPEGRDAARGAKRVARGPAKQDAPNPKVPTEIPNHDR